MATTKPAPKPDFDDTGRRAKHVQFGDNPVTSSIEIFYDSTESQDRFKRSELFYQRAKEVKKLRKMGKENYKTAARHEHGTKTTEKYSNDYDDISEMGWQGNKYTEAFYLVAAIGIDGANAVIRTLDNVDIRKHRLKHAVWKFRKYEYKEDPELKPAHPHLWAFTFYDPFEHPPKGKDVKTDVDQPNGDHKTDASVSSTEDKKSTGGKDHQSIGNNIDDKTDVDVGIGREAVSQADDEKSAEGEIAPTLPSLLLAVSSAVAPVVAGPEPADEGQAKGSDDEDDKCPARVSRTGQPTHTPRRGRSTRTAAPNMVSCSAINEMKPLRRSLRIAAQACLGISQPAHHQSTSQ